ncbi:MAG: hypothetical protein Q9190_006810 [Brigantiaea leucoxantha]
MTDLGTKSRFSANTYTHLEEHCPIIVDDSYDLAETATLSFGGEHREGLLADGEVGAALLSMSGYGKSPVPNVNNYATNRTARTNSNNNLYDPSRSLRDPGYLPYAQNEFAGSEVQPLPATYDHGGGQLPYQTTPYYQPRAAFEIAPPSFPSFISRKNPAVTSFYPKRGPQGTHFYVYLESEHDLLAPTRLNIYLLFASRRCQSILTRLESQSANYVWVITADVPSFSLTGWRSPEVPLQLELQEESGLAVGTVGVGTFTYSDYQQLQTPSPAFPRKRKLSIDTTEMMQLGAKRPATEQLLSREAQDFVSDLYSHNQSSAYPHYSRSFTPNSLPSTYSSYDAVQKGVRKRSSTFSGGMNRSQSHVRAASHHAPGWSSAYAGGLHSGRSPALSATPASRVSSVPSPSMSANPPLIRTSTLQQNSGTAPGPSSISSSGSFNPYALYPHKAVLKINGDLDSMADHWTPDEWAMKRRIVQFWRSQTGSTITTNFEPVSPDNRPPNSICISCIWWEERQECFVTSVDTIYLLESLVAVRFTVEEKNRIRRNLEGFRPMTVSKAKSDSEDFFRIIMGFPNPKPRNIEKDVKVFPWKILAHALKKIFGKYVSHITSVHTFLTPPQKGNEADHVDLSKQSASYSSTAGALRAPRTNVYGTTSQPDPPASNGDYYSNSPSNSAGSSSGYSSHNMATASVSPTNVSQGQRVGHYADAANLDDAVSSAPQPASSFTLSSSASSLQYPYTTSAEQQANAAAPVPIHSTRSSWDFSSFLEPSPAATGESSSAQPPANNPDSLQPAASTQSTSGQQAATR